jgi:hypothetical protein
VTTSFAKIAICLPRNASLGFGDRFNGYLPALNQIIEATTDNWISNAVHHDCCLDIVDCGYSTNRIFDEEGEGGRLRFASKNGDQR